jgi:hypothetical protein
VSFASHHDLSQANITRRAAVRIGGAHPVFLPDVNGQRLFLGPLHLFQQQGLLPQNPMMAAPYDIAMGVQAPQHNAPAQGAQVAHLLFKLMAPLLVSMSLQVSQSRMPAVTRFLAHPMFGLCIASTSILPSLLLTLSSPTTKSVSLPILNFN